MRDLWTVSSEKFAMIKKAIMRNGKYLSNRERIHGIPRNSRRVWPGRIGRRYTGGQSSIALAMPGESRSTPQMAGSPKSHWMASAISARATTIRNHRQVLDLQNAAFERETEYEAQDKMLRISSTRFLSADKPNLGVIKYSIRCDKAAKVRIDTGIDYNIWDLNGPHLLHLRCGKARRRASCQRR